MSEYRGALLTFALLFGVVSLASAQQLNLPADSPMGYDNLLTHNPGKASGRIPGGSRVVFDTGLMGDEYTPNGPSYLSTSRSGALDVLGDDGFYSQVSSNTAAFGASGLLQVGQDKEQFWASVLDASAWTSIGTPIVTTNQDSGPWSVVAGGAEADLIEDNDGAAGEGLRSSSAGTTIGYYTAECWLRSGTETTARIAVTAVGGTGSTTCNVTGLTSTYTRHHCTADVAGSPTGIHGDLIVGDEDSDTGTIYVSGCNLWDAPYAPEMDSQTRTVRKQVVSAPSLVSSLPLASEVSALELTVIFSLFGDSTDFTEASETWYLIDSRDTADSSSGFVWSRNPTKTGIGFSVRGEDVGNGEPGQDPGTQTLATGGAPVITAGTQYIARVHWQRDAEACWARQYFDACPDETDCQATTELVTSDVHKTCVDNHNALLFGSRIGSQDLSMSGHLRRITLRVVPRQAAPFSLPGSQLLSFDAETTCPSVGSGNTLSTWTDLGSLGEDATTAAGTVTCEEDSTSGWYAYFTDDELATATFTGQSFPLTMCIKAGWTSSIGAGVNYFTDGNTNRVIIGSNSGTAWQTNTGGGFLSSGVTYSTGAYDVSCAVLNGATSRSYTNSPLQGADGAAGTGTEMTNLRIGVGIEDARIQRIDVWSGDVLEDALNGYRQEGGVGFPETF